MSNFTKTNELPFGASAEQKAAALSLDLVNAGMSKDEVERSTSARKIRRAARVLTDGEKRALDVSRQKAAEAKMAKLDALLDHYAKTQTPLASVFDHMDLAVKPKRARPKQSPGGIFESAARAWERAELEAEHQNGMRLAWLRQQLHRRGRRDV